MSTSLVTVAAHRFCQQFGKHLNMQSARATFLYRASLAQTMLISSCDFARWQCKGRWMFMKRVRVVDGILRQFGGLLLF